MCLTKKASEKYKSQLPINEAKKGKHCWIIQFQRHITLPRFLRNDQAAADDYNNVHYKFIFFTFL